MPDYDAIKARAGAATEGPWDVFGQGGGHNYRPGIGSGGDIIVAEMWDDRDNDAEFIAHARQDIPTLLAVIDAVRALTGMMRGAQSVGDPYPLTAWADDIDRALEGGE